jgi:hypothetical protein
LLSKGIAAEIQHPLYAIEEHHRLAIIVRVHADALLVVLVETRAIPACLAITVFNKKKMLKMPEAFARGNVA